MNNNLIGILGAGKSGIASCELALKFGYRVVLSDILKDKKIPLTINTTKSMEAIAPKLQK